MVKKIQNLLKKSKNKLLTREEHCRSEIEASKWLEIARQQRYPVKEPYITIGTLFLFGCYLFAGWFGCFGWEVGDGGLDSFSSLLSMGRGL